MLGQHPAGPHPAPRPGELPGRPDSLSDRLHRQGWYCSTCVEQHILPNIGRNLASLAGEMQDFTKGPWPGHVYRETYWSRKEHYNEPSNNYPNPHRYCTTCEQHRPEEEFQEGDGTPTQCHRCYLEK